MMISQEIVNRYRQATTVHPPWAWFAPCKVVQFFELDPASDMELNYGQETES